MCMPWYGTWGDTILSTKRMDTWKDRANLLPLVLDKIIAAEGGLVPDFEMQHGGCSKRKRKLKGADSAALRSYQPSAAVAAVAEKRCKELRQQAEEMGTPAV